MFLVYWFLGVVFFDSLFVVSLFCCVWLVVVFCLMVVRCLLFVVCLWVFDVCC